MRRRVDGHKFQKEFEKAFEDKYYILRLYTPNTGYSGLTQPADFLVVGEHTTFVELKETGADSLSITQLQQLPEIYSFVEQRQQLRFKAEYLLIVHFIKHSRLLVLTAEQLLATYAKQKSLRYDMPNARTYPTLKALKEANIF